MELDRYDPVQRYYPHRPDKPLGMISGSASFPLLEFIFNPKRSSMPMQDAILISFDLESRIIKTLGKLQITQIGIASFDTRTLANIDTSDSQSLVSAIQNRVFNVYRKRAAARGWVPKPLWTTPEEISHDEICDKLDEIFYNPSGDLTTDHKEPRDVILVGHAVASDRGLLKNVLGYDIKHVTSIKAILDTGRMVCCAYDLGVASHGRYTLRRILRIVGVHYDQFHNAGNDAMFTMKALLLMFCNWKHQKGKHLWNIAEDVALDATAASVAETMLWDCQLEALVAIAREPRPVVKKAAKPVRYTGPIEGKGDLLSSPEDLNLVDILS